MTHAPVEAVMFDMDGTLVDSRAAIVASYHDASSEVLGHPHPTDEHELEEILKLRAAEAFPRVVGTDDPERVGAFGDAFLAAYRRHQDSVPGFPGLEEGLQRLVDLGVRLGIATSKARIRLDLDLDRLGIARFFDFTVSGDEVPEGKPAPDPILAVAAGLGVPVEHGLYVGDGENDIRAAHAAGMRAVGVAFGFHPEACRAENPEYFVESYAELADLVAELRPARASPAPRSPPRTAMARHPLTTPPTAVAAESPDVVGERAEAAALERPPLLVLRPLEAFLDAHGLGSGPIAAEPIGDGHSNVTYLIRRGEERWVLRRPPRGPLPPSAHDVLRECRFLVACAAGGVRAPRPVATCDDPAVIGAPFYVMSYIEGVVLTTQLPGGLDADADPPRIADELVAGLAEIHALDWRAAGLGDGLPPPESYLERQVRRFTSLWEHNRTRDLPLVDRTAAWLAERIPVSGPPTLVHGDYRLGNTIFSASSPAVLRAVLDWEMATLGDPLADLGYLTATWAVPSDADGTLSRLGAVTAGPGFPDRDGLAERYTALSGREVSSLPWYQALALWKGVVFLEGSYGRWLAGSTDDAFFARLDKGVPELAERAWEFARAGGAR